MNVLAPEPEELDLVAEYDELAVIGDDLVEYLNETYGICADDLFLAGCRVARVKPVGRIYYPYPRGLYRAIIIPVWAYDQLVNLIGFNPKTPSAWWTRCFCRGDVLGPIEVLDTAAAIASHYYAYPTPFAWLRGHRRGVVHLDRGPWT